jgi:hypothetical protein
VSAQGAKLTEQVEVASVDDFVDETADEIGRRVHRCRSVCGTRRQAGSRGGGEVAGGDDTGEHGEAVA